MMRGRISSSNRRGHERRSGGVTCHPSAFLVAVAAVWVCVLMIFSLALVVQERNKIVTANRVTEMGSMHNAVRKMKGRLDTLSYKQEMHQKNNLRPSKRPAYEVMGEKEHKQAPESQREPPPQVPGEAVEPEPEPEVQAPPPPPPPIDSDTSPVPLVDPTILTKEEIIFDGDANYLCEKQTADSQLVNQLKVWDGAEMGKPRILCMSYTLSKFHPTAVKDIRQTWGRKCDGYIAMSDKTDPMVPSIDIKHTGPESYDNMWQKVRSIWKYVHKHHVKEYDYFILGGDDLFVVVENLRKYLTSDEIVKATEEGTKPIFLGRRFQTAKGEEVFNSGGAGYVINAPALELLAEGINTRQKCRPNQVGFWEDVNVAHCLHVQGVDAYDTRDEEHRERFMPFRPGDHLLYKIPPKHPDWFAVYTANVGGLIEGAAGVSPYVISFHYVKNNLMNRIYALFYGLCNKPPQVGEGAIGADGAAATA